MKRNALVFTGAFLLGFVVLASRDKTSASDLSKVENASEPRASSSRLDDAFTEYEAVIFDEEEKVQRLLEEANTLSSLLGLAEKLFSGGDYNENGLMMVAAKLAKLYPEDAIEYYARRPTNVIMNEEMEEKILQSWAACDLTACLTFLDQDQTRSFYDVCRSWTSLVNQEWPDKSADILRSFSQLSREKQNKIVREGYFSEELLLVLLPELKDQQLRSDTEIRLKRAEEQRAPEKTETQERQKSPEDLAREKCDAMIEEIKDRKLAAEDIAIMLRDEKSRDNRMRVLSGILERRMDDETADAWLVRVSEVFAVVDEIPDGPPSHSGKGVDPSRKELQAWLPKQSARLQWAWADNVVNQMHGEDAMQWIDKLSQASLRMDLRDQALESWATDSPAEAAEYMVEKASNTEQEDYLPTAVYRWALQDYAAAKQWINAQADSPAKAAALKKLKPGK